MALYTENEYLKCTSCGNDTFTEAEIFRIIKKPVKTTLTNTTTVEKQVIGNGIKCTKCETVMTNPLKK